MIVSLFPLVCHAEYNAILNKGTTDIRGDNIFLYSTLHPCKECALFIVHSGIRHVRYLPKDAEKYKDGQDLLENAGVDSR